MADVLAYFEAYHDIRLLEQTKQEENEMQDENDMGAAYVKVYEKKALLDHMVNYFSQQAEETFLESKPENIENWCLWSLSMNYQICRCPHWKYNSIVLNIVLLSWSCLLTVLFTLGGAFGTGGSFFLRGLWTN